MTAPKPQLLSIRNMDVRFGSGNHEIRALNGVSLDIRRGQIFGLIGETGAGKSLAAWATLGLLPHNARQAGGEVTFEQEVITGLSPQRMREIRGAKIAIIGQNPLGALDPTRRIGDQVVDAMRSHQRIARREAWQRAVEGLRAVGIADPERRARAWPHELSGGMAQRVLIAIAIINSPLLLIADEPTTGLDVTIQAEILDLLAGLVRGSGMTIWMITHDLGVLANYCDHAGVMFAGEIVETAPISELFNDPKHPYTISLLDLQSEDLEAPEGEESRTPPNLANRPAGCQFHYRCPWVQDICRTEHPALLAAGTDHEVRCFVASSRQAAERQPRKVEGQGC
jgi:oligopeptide/dipeptide ABC transporter ATP-binding protein